MISRSLDGRLSFCAALGARFPENVQGAPIRRVTQNGPPGASASFACLSSSIKEMYPYCARVLRTSDVVMAARSTSPCVSGRDRLLSLYTPISPFDGSPRALPLQVPIPACINSMQNARFRIWNLLAQSRRRSCGSDLRSVLAQP